MLTAAVRAIVTPNWPPRLLLQKTLLREANRCFFANTSSTNAGGIATILWENLTADVLLDHSSASAPLKTKDHQDEPLTCALFQKSRRR